MRIDSLAAEHILELQEHHNLLTAFKLTPEMAAVAIEHDGWTAWDGPMLLGAGGIMDQGGGCGRGWVLLAPVWWKHARAITALCAQKIRTSGFPRVEALVHCDFEKGHVWARRVGMTCEAERMRWYAAGEDYALYARVDDGA